MSAAISAFLAIFVSLGMQLLGEAFIKKVLLVGLKAWAKSTASEYDDEVVKAFSEAWGVDYKAVVALPEVKK
jgi:hypothetical protein